MRQNLSTRMPTEVVLIGFPQLRAELLQTALKAALEESGLQRCNFYTLEESLAEVNPEDIKDVIILAGDRGLSNTDIMAAAQRLRTAEFVWSPIYLFTLHPLAQANLAQNWSIYPHTLPVSDMAGLAASVRSARPLGQPRRVDILSSALISLGDLLGSLMRALDSTKVIEEADLRQTIEHLSSSLAAAPSHLVYKQLATELARMIELPAISESDIDTATPLARAAERHARDANHSETLRVALHRFNGEMALAKWRPGVSQKIAKRTKICVEALEKRGATDLPLRLQEQTHKLCHRLDSTLQVILNGKHGEEILDNLSDSNAILVDIVQRLKLSQPATNANSPLKRIVVVEDDSRWRIQIKRLLAAMPLLEDVDVQEAGSVEEAELLLKGSSALVLIDLGLPTTVGSDIDLDAGLFLIKQYVGSDSQGNNPGIPGSDKNKGHRFIVLTAAENHTKAVRGALALGISPWSYLQKRAETWEGELRAQVRLAFSRSEAKTVTIEVFKRTGRIARVEGVEIILDLPQWCLLTTLVDARRWWCSRDRLARELYYIYSLDPASRSDKTAGLDPIDRLEKQIPNYIYELRMRINKAVMQAHHQAPVYDILQSDDEMGYRLNARARIIDRVDEHFQLKHRPSVLVVEDDPHWGAEIVRELNCRGFQTQWAKWLEQAWELLREQPPDLLSLDLELPETEFEWFNKQASADRTITFLHKLRSYYPDIPVAVLTAISWQDNVMLEVLRQGVRIDDYLSKQESMSTARLATSLGRMLQESLTGSRILDWDPTMPIHRIEIDAQSRMLKSVDGYPIKKPSELIKRLLEVLSATPNFPVSRTEIIKAVYPDEDERDSSSDAQKKAGSPDEGLKHLVKRLRKDILLATDNTVGKYEVICGDYGVYWLRGIVQ